ncbi:MAG: hypothetical protein AAF565_17240, partial [Pseudomonadota bacterium]
RLSEVGRREEALAAAEEAVALRRTLAAARPEAFTPNLAMSLGALGQVQRQTDPALAAQTFADGLQRIAPLLEAVPEAFSGLATALFNDLKAASEEAGAQPDAALVARIEAALTKARR